ncbi:MAG: prolipoprotein diacylglyceryl transferase [Kiritimatiellia bacterium]|jgi:phosphatidylglycerol:prolipoprotein diacylglycerol transferase
MHPILFSLDQFTIHSFGACLAIAILACYFTMVRLAKSMGHGPDFVSSILTVLIVSGLIGARLFYVFENWPYYSKHPASIIKVQEGGLVFYGGFILGTLALIGFSLVKKVRILDVLDLVATAVPLGHAIGRVGCFLNGCCYGRDSNACIAVTFPRGSIPWNDQLAKKMITLAADRSLPVLPSQLFETVLNLVVFGVMLLLFRRRRRRPGFLAAAYATLYAVVRFAVEFTRGDPRLHVGPLSIGQLISLVIFIGGLAATLALARKSKLETGNLVAPN